MKKTLIALLLALSLVLAAGCGSKDPATSPAADPSSSSSSSAASQEDTKQNYAVIDGDTITCERFGLSFQIPEGYRLLSDDEIRQLTGLAEDMIKDDLTASQGAMLEGSKDILVRKAVMLLNETTGVSLQLQFYDQGMAGFDIPQAFEKELKPAFAGVLQNISDLSETTIAGAKAYTFTGEMAVQGVTVSEKLWMLGSDRYLLQLVGASGQGLEPLDELIGSFSALV